MKDKIDEMSKSVLCLNLELPEEISKDVTRRWRDVLIVLEKLREPVLALKYHLSDEGEYSVSRTDKKPMGWGEVIMIGNIFEEIDEALKLTGE